MSGRFRQTPRHWWSRARFLRTLAFLSALAPSAVAHDFWIEPSSFRPVPGAVVAVRLRVGDGFRGAALPRDPLHLERFVVVDSRGAREIAGRAGADPAGTFRAGEAGAHVLGYESGPTFVQLEAGQFHAYLRDKGLEMILAARERRGDGAAPGREIFSRYAKSLLSTPGAEGAFERPLGLRLEILPETDPTAASPRSLPFQVRFQGAALESALVVATPAWRPEAVVKGRTDADGRVVLTLDRPGPWLLSTVHMIPAPAGSAADWESLWASLTFERIARHKR